MTFRRKCPVCDKEFKRGYRRGKCCSLECLLKWLKAAIRGA